MKKGLRVKVRRQEFIQDTEDIVALSLKLNDLKELVNIGLGA